MLKHVKLRTTMVAILVAVSFSPTHAAEETQTAEELRNTVINLLEALVQKGVLTREQAQSLVADAQAVVGRSVRGMELDAGSRSDRSLRRICMSSRFS